MWVTVVATGLRDSAGPRRERGLFGRGTSRTETESDDLDTPSFLKDL
jgi:hypothetical protein